MKITQFFGTMMVLDAAYAHTILHKVNGGAQGNALYMPSSDNPITDVTTSALACNGPEVNSGFQSSREKITVQAGSTVTGSWIHTLTSTGADHSADNEYIDSSHKGPLSTYLKKVDDATKNPSAGPGKGWFKIAHAGLSNGRWAVDDLISHNGVQKTVIPQCIENGDYLLRFELIALHSAYSNRGAQIYVGCAQISVVNGTATKTPSTVSIPGAYAQNDPGILVQIWVNGKPYPSSYQIPGPAVFTC